MKNVFYVIAIAFFFTACNKEELRPISGNPELDDLLRQFPSELTIDNWEEFVYAPKEVIDYFDAKEKRKVRRNSSRDEAPSSRNNGSGWVKAFSGNWDFLAGTKVEWGSQMTNSTSSSVLGHNFSFSSQGSGEICFHHKGKTLGNYSRDEWVDGVTANDMTKIRHHILGLVPFTTIREHVAADVNNDGRINQDDLDAISHVILNQAQSFSEFDQPVVYVPADNYDYWQNELTNCGCVALWSDIVLKSECSSTGNSLEANRYAIKLGDVSGNWNHE